MPVNLIFILLFFAIAAHAQQERVAIINTVDDGEPPMKHLELGYLTDKLRETASNVLPKSQYGVMTTESIVAFLGSHERMVSECKAASCLAELGRKVSADYVAQARIGRFGEDLTIKVELYDTKKGNLLGSFTGDSKNIYGLRDIINEKASELFKKMLYKEPPLVVATPPPPVAAPPPRQNFQQMQQPAPPEKPVVSMANTYRQVFLFEEIQKLLKDGFKKNKEEIQSKSVSLSDANREYLYNEHRKTTIGSIGYAVVLNFPYLFGLGSYLQGNTKAGVAQSVLEVAGLGVIFAAEANNYEKYDNLIITGAILLYTGWLTGLIAPFIYQSTYNTDLKEALEGNSVSYSIEPLIVPRDGMPAVGLAFNGRF